ncbi:MAG: hypothetical protein M1294_07395 [Firmicutes bacterium]|jgi:hypothetical protein|nr:hypothetical protein [Bacillota bacterium]MCL5015876.1 hypothetical protein [Bacillota bacterium]
MRRREKADSQDRLRLEGGGVLTRRNWEALSGDGRLAERQGGVEKSPFLDQGVGIFGTSDRVPDLYRGQGVKQDDKLASYSCRKASTGLREEA